MRPFTIYHLFRDSFATLQQTLIDLVLKVAKPDLIFLLGATLGRRRSESIFCQESPTASHISDCFFLILMPELAGKEPYEWQDKIENSCRAVLPVTTLVLENFRFEEWLKEGHPFATSVQRSAMAIFDSGNFKIPIADAAPEEQVLNPLQKHEVDGLARAKEFLAGSEFFRIRKQYGLSAFMLHQSAEQSLRTLVKLGTGYRSHTHNIDRLIRYAGLAFYQLPDIFPKKTEEGKRIFNLLQSAYIAPRYNETYKISTDDLLRLTKKVQWIHDILANAIKRHAHQQC
ncbi:MAG TPA: HEPN domain-containing protein [Puia sp.]|nr:HEPN domain-containing protein [Puia sp.]